MFCFSLSFSLVVFLTSFSSSFRSLFLVSLLKKLQMEAASSSSSSSASFSLSFFPLFFFFFFELFFFFFFELFFFFSFSFSSAQQYCCEVCHQPNCRLVCSRCRSVSDCSKEHQKRDWPRHKPRCESFSCAVSVSISPFFRAPTFLFSLSSFLPIVK